MEEIEDLQLQNAIDYLKNNLGKKGYMICASFLDEEKNVLNHISFLGSFFKDSDVENSFKENIKNIKKLVDEKNESSIKDKNEN